ncbi:PaeR7I family type II restriction endonuclease [Sulfoacidibacillus ferrooxidans]|uniref:Type-2 restriction enzyme PaeR7I n=1 Tax=Sulfoacidibacillus ferrooxidans TaxID=2005001 RepID=A0A9X2AEI7_9BACL|nr:PaeR7I family type II restriction endonuclease [Sulfoacidibacillus ferrooxidans]MCI0184615.1 Type-2 restriction enzyme PaeR7I [Sulfoacidibacillus ferrooxidans]
MDIFIPSKEELEHRTNEAISFFWTTRTSQRDKNSEGNVQNQGTRGSVTGGKQLNGFLKVLRWILTQNGVLDEEIFTSGKLELPGFYRPSKQWDLVVIRKQPSGGKRLIAAIELKSQVGSFGNNFNNRTEEAMGSSLDILTAYREGAFGDSAPSPWLGYLMVLEESLKSTVPVRVAEPHFKVFNEFRDTSYAKRYELFCKKLLLERNYTAAAFLMSNQEAAAYGGYSEPASDLTMHSFVRSLVGHIIGS